MTGPFAFLFPGQGSQAVGMGKELCGRFSVARAVFAEADEVLGLALSRLCFDGPVDELTLTANTQPAILTASYAVTRVLADALDMRPSWVAGHSLGEFSALLAAGALQFADALRVVRARGEAMQAAVPPGVGAMAAVLGLDRPLVEAVCSEAAQGQVVSPANFNGVDQIVISGHRDAVSRAGQLAKQRGAKRVLPLAVSAPFHCALMEPAAERLRAVLQAVPVAQPSCPLISNVEARACTDAQQIKPLLIRQVVSAVRWQECVDELARLGCRHAIEAGPGRVLTGLTKRIAADIRCVPADDFAALEALAAAA